MSTTGDQVIWHSHQWLCHAAIQDKTLAKQDRIVKWRKQGRKQYLALIPNVCATATLKQYQGKVYKELELHIVTKIIPQLERTQC